MHALLLQGVLTLAVLYFIHRKVNGWLKYTSYPPTARGIWLPFLGHMFSFGSDPVSFFQKQMEMLKCDAFSFELFGRDCVFMGSDDALGAFYTAPEEVLSAAEAYKFMIPAFGPNVVYDCPDKKFQEQRKFLGKCLTISAFKKMVGIISQETETYLDQIWKEKGSLDFYHDVGELIIRTSTHALQGPQIRSMVHLGYAKYMEDIDGALSILSFFYPNLPMPSFLKRNAARKNIGDLIKSVLQARRESTIPEEPDFLEMLSSSTYSDGTTITDEQIAGLCVALMLAGQHTSNITSTWLGIFLLSNPTVLAAVKEEQDRVWPEGEELDFDKLRNMEYLQLCIKETLRVRPPIILVWRKAIKKFQYNDWTIPEGTLVCVSPAVSGRQESLGWTDTDSFDPSRFTRKEDKTANYGYIPFSRGKHSCIGEKFAYLQIKIIWSIILRRYKVNLKGTVKDYPVDPTSLLAGPVSPVTINYEKLKL